MKQLAPLISTKTATVMSLLGSVLFSAYGSAQTRLLVNPNPIIDIRGTTSSGTVLFEYAVAAMKLAGGTIVVADRAANSLRYFNQRGEVTTVAGRGGSGPGEFQAISWLGKCAPDSVFVYDLALQRVSVYGASGEFARQYVIEATRGFRPTASAIVCSSRGVMAVHSVPRSFISYAEDPTIMRGRARLALLDASGNITALGDSTNTPEVLGGRGRGVTPRPLGKFTSLAIAHDRLYVGTADSAWLRVYTLDGQRSSDLRLNLPPARRVTPEAYEQEARQIADQVPPPYRTENLTRALQAMPPRELPPYRSLIGDSEGFLWLLLSAPGEGHTLLRSVAPDGSTPYEIMLPRELVVFEVGRDFILGAYQAADGEQHIVEYSFRRV